MKATNEIAKLMTEDLPEKGTPEKEILYAIMEVMPGKTISNNILNLPKDRRQDILSSGVNINEFEDSEPEPKLGNGGLGRLAACMFEYVKMIALYAESPAVQSSFAKQRLAAKRRLSEYILKTRGIEIPPDFIFDVHCKRFHEYKRQQLNINRIFANSLSKPSPSCPLNGQRSPRTFALSMHTWHT